VLQKACQGLADSYGSQGTASGSSGGPAASDTVPAGLRPSSQTLARDDRDDQVAAAVMSAKEGDRDAFRYLYLRYARDVYRYVLSIVRHPHEAEDVTQQVFTKLLTVIGSYEQLEVPFSAWILRIARNLAVDHLRSSRRMVPCEEVRAEGDSAEYSTPDLVSSLREALASLPADQGQVVALRHIVGLSPSDIAVRLGKSEASVHGLHHRGRQALRQALRASMPARAA
jgi:RNA polymerase sigma-70 factor, ECF subfamily